MPPATWDRAVQPAARNLSPAERPINDGGVEVPNNFAVGGVIGSKVAIHRTGKNDSVNGGDGLRKSGIAPNVFPGANGRFGRGSVPDNCAIDDADCRQAGAFGQ